MTTAIYFNEMPTHAQQQRTPKDCSGDRDGETVTTYVRKAKPNSKIKKLRIRLIITKMQAKNFGSELISLHSNRRHRTPESALGNSPSSRPVSHKIKLKETDRKNGRVSHNVRNQEYVRPFR